MKDQMLFAKRMSFLVKSNVTIIESLHIIREQANGKSAQHLYAELAKDIESGKFLSQSMKRFKGAFSDFSLSVVRVGEMSGALSQNLHYLAEELQKRYELRRKIVSAMIYPLFITVATIGLTAGLTVYIFPKIVPIFASLRVDLPWTTRMLISVSDFIRAYGLVSLLVFVLAVMASIFVVRRYRAVRQALHEFTLSLPIIGKVVRGYNVANFTRTLGLLIRSGVTVTDAIGITGEATPNLVYRRALQKMAESVKRGKQVSVSLNGNTRLFPPLVPHMVAIGEKTGKLSDSLIYIGAMYEADIDELVKNLSGILEPVIMVFMGLLVGLIAISVIAPIYEITQGLHR